jgi:broad specificity phosphatase PhoE
MSLPRRIDAIRHPQWDGNLATTQSLLHSDRDFSEGPNALGEQQALRLGRDHLRYVPRPDLVISSPFLRAYRGIELAAAEAWPGIDIVTDDRLIEQNKGTDPGDYYEDDNLPDRKYPGGETLREVGRRVLELLQEPQHADKHVVLSTHARLMLALRWELGGHDYITLRDQGLPGGLHGIMIGNCQMDSYERVPNPVTGELPEWFNVMHIRQTWGDDPLDSGPIPTRERI